MGEAGGVSTATSDISASHICLIKYRNGFSKFWLRSGYAMRQVKCVRWLVEEFAAEKLRDQDLCVAMIETPCESRPNSCHVMRDVFGVLRLVRTDMLPEGLQQWRHHVSRVAAVRPVHQPWRDKLRVATLPSTGSTSTTNFESAVFPPRPANCCYNREYAVLSLYRHASTA
jgi:hypothetical protein